jgi:hypothetical protein
MGLTIAKISTISTPAANAPEAEVSEVQSKGAINKTYKVGDLEMDVIPWDKFVARKPQKKLELNQLYKAAFFVGTREEDLACYKDWGWRFTRYAHKSNDESDFVRGTGIWYKTSAFFKEKYSTELIRQVKNEFGRRVTPQNYVKFLRSADAKTVIRLACLTLESLVRYRTEEDLERMDNKREFPHFYENGHFLITCHEYTYTLKNIVNWLKRDMDIGSLDAIHVIESFAPGKEMMHMWPTLVEFKEDGNVNLVNIDPTFDDFYEGNGAHLATEAGFTNKLNCMNFNCNIMLGMAILYKTRGIKAADKELKEMCGEMFDKYDASYVLGGFYSNFPFYMQIDHDRFDKAMQDGDLSRPEFIEILYNGIMDRIVIPLKQKE